MKLTWSQCGGSKLTCFQCRDEIGLVVLWVVEIHLLLEWWRKITCFQDEYGNLRGYVCRVCEFRVRVWKSYRTSRSAGYCGTGVQNLQKFRTGMKMLYPYPGCCVQDVQILQKFRARVWMSYITHRSSLCGYGCCKELTEVTGTGNTRVNTRPRRRTSI